MLAQRVVTLYSWLVHRSSSSAWPSAASLLIDSGRAGIFADRTRNAGPCDETTQVFLGLGTRRTETSPLYPSSLLLYPSPCLSRHTIDVNFSAEQGETQGPRHGEVLAHGGQCR